MAFTLVTVTYRGDLGPFRSLCASIDQLMPDIEHHVLVDRSDKGLFDEFANKKRKIIDCAEILPDYHEFSIGKKRLWVRWPLKIVRGWIYQQLVKIGYIQTLRTDAAVIVDSDALFIRAIEPSDLFADQAVKMYQHLGRSSGPEDQSSKWHDAASSALGLEPRGYTGADYISTAVIWSPEVLRKMTARIWHSWSMPWDRVLTRFFRFSEYVVYGVFCDHVAGDHRPMIEATDAELCHCSWHFDLSSQAGRTKFAAGLQDHHRAVLIQSNLGLSEDERRSIMEKFNSSSSAKALPGELPQ